MKVYGIVNCGSVKKARAFFEANGIEYDFIDFKKIKPDVTLVQGWVEICGIDVVMNKKGTTYKKLGLKDKTLNLQEQIQYCVDNPSLIKRPVIVKNDILIFGYDEEKYKETFC